MKKAGFWRRWIANLIDLLLIIVTIGIMLIVNIIKFFRGKPTFGKKTVGISYSDKTRQGKLFGCLILQFFLLLLLVTIIINIIKIVTKNGSFAENWANNFLKID
ncbi:hypothetical protein [Mesoplasma photuris]|uniref:hypothetical protein n=1 Tax=Mesoplasma photuris TaxID=217731 RepID=UPI0004E0EC66|nr:hypothetical protein [Mesoplasma photuris]